MFSNKAANPKIETIVGPGTELEGNLRTTESLRIDGRIKGEIHAETIMIGENGVVLGDITATRVTIAGKVKGNVAASQVLEILPTGHVLGDIRSHKLVISDGATFEGNSQMTKSDGQVLELPTMAERLPEDGKLRVVNGNGKHH
jgi:cytoskeletal protein CcmA (bactofilin family)